MKEYRVRIVKCNDRGIIASKEVIIINKSKKQRTAKVFYGTIDEVYVIATRYKPVTGFSRSISIA